MKLKRAVACLVVVIGAPVGVVLAAGTATPSAAAAPAKGLHETHKVEKRATIIEIDKANRLVVLKAQDGEFVVEAGPEIANFDKLQVGDVVVATYTQALGVRIEPAGTASPGVKETASATPAPGQAKVGREVTATLKVESVDAANNTVTLSDGAGHSAPVDVVDPRARERLKTLKPGEMVVITYTEALALRLEKVAAK
jgi:hypothetical protein